MKKLSIPIHSFVDVITNSSTVIYVQVHGKTVELMKDLVNYLLQKGGSEKTADDLFDFKVVNSEEWAEEKVEEIMGDEFSEEQCPDLTWDERNEKAEAVFKERLANGDYSDCEDENYNGYDRRILMMIPKDNHKEGFDVAAKFSSIFEIDGGFDG